jgi:uncharacterized protein CbrC (UPF0167 family)
MHHLAGLSPEEIERICKLSEGEARRQLDEADRLLPALMQVKPPAEPVPVPARGFRYLLDPETEVSGRPGSQPCVACDEMRPGFDLVVIHDDGWHRHYVCEPCLRAGRLAERGLRMNEAEREVLATQHAAVKPELPPAEQEALARERTREVEHTTPRPRIWQPFLWPAHCGDYHGYVKQVGKADLILLAPDGDGKAFFERHVRREEWTDGEWVAAIWEEGFAPQGFVNAYLWRCLHCGEHLITWDHE